MTVVNADDESASTCSNNPVSLGNTPYTADATIQSGVSITSANVIKNTAHVTYQAPVVTLTSGFVAEAGSTFSVKAMNVTCPSLSLPIQELSNANAWVVQDFNTATTEWYPVSQWLSYADLPEKLKTILDTEQASAYEIQTDAQGILILFSTDKDLLETDTNGLHDIYTFNTETEELSLISITPDHTAGNGVSTQARINGTGDYIVYRSEADNLLSSDADNNGVADIYLHHVPSSIQNRVSYALDGKQTSNAANHPNIAGDTPYLVYDIHNNTVQQVNAVDISQETIMVEQISPDDSPYDKRMDHTQPAISADGRYVFYLGQSQEEAQSCTQHILDRETGQSEVSLCPDAIQQNPEQWVPQFDSNAETIIWNKIE